jgi:hypothetical protein
MGRPLRRSTRPLDEPPAVAEYREPTVSTRAQGNIAGLI